MEIFKQSFNIFTDKFWQVFKNFYENEVFVSNWILEKPLIFFIEFKCNFATNPATPIIQKVFIYDYQISYYIKKWVLKKN